MLFIFITHSEISKANFFFCFLKGPYLQHMELPRLGVKLEVQLLAYTTATTMQDQSFVYDLHHSSRQRQILNPLSEARDQTRNLMVPSWVRFHCTTTGTPGSHFCSPICYSRQTSPKLLSTQISFCSSRCTFHLLSYWQPELKCLKQNLPSSSSFSFSWLLTYDLYSTSTLSGLKP